MDMSIITCLLVIIGVACLMKAISSDDEFNNADASYMDLAKAHEDYMNFVSIGALSLIMSIILLVLAMI